MNNVKDIASTLVGGTFAFTLLGSVRWESIPNGESVKIIVAFALLIVSYFMYKGGVGKDVQ